MDEGVEFTGKTVEDAVAAAETGLGASRASFTIEVVTQGSRGVFGIGAEPARIVVRRPEAAPRPEPIPAERIQPLDVQSPIAQAEEPQDTDDDVDSDDTPQPAPGDGANLPAEAREVLGRLLASMGFDVEVEVRSEGTPIILSVSGENLGVLIGRRGDNLASLQFMVNLILSKNRRQWPKVVIDVENYRARREESLRSLADRIAYRVARGGRPFTLEAMSASDRRIIHLALREREDVETYSIGEGASRRVVIAPLQAGVARSAEADRI